MTEEVKPATPEAIAALMGKVHKITFVTHVEPDTGRVLCSVEQADDLIDMELVALISYIADAGRGICPDHPLFCAVPQILAAHGVHADEAPSASNAN